MKYKAVLSINSSGGGNPDGVASHSFFTKAQAEQCCQAWAESADRFAHLWDGSQWTFYN